MFGSYRRSLNVANTSSGWVHFLVATASVVGSAPAIAQCNLVHSQKLWADVPGVTHQFGRSVAFDGQWLAVGHPGSGAPDEAGRVDVFRFDGTSFHWSQTLAASAPVARDRFGHSVACRGNLVVVGSPNYDDPADETGRVYVYRLAGSTWQLEAELAPSGAYQFDHLGTSVAVDGNVIAVGAPWRNDPGDSGSVFVFRFNGSAWIEEAELKAQDKYNYDFLGTAVDIDGNVIVAGAPWRNDPADSGSVFVFRFNGAQWVEEDELKARDAYNYDFLGMSVAIDGDIIVAGAPYRNSPGDSGGAFVFRYNGFGWVEEAELKGTDRSGARMDYWFLGRAVDVDGDTIIAGAVPALHNDERVDFDDAAQHPGLAHVFQLTNGSWSEVSRLPTDTNGSLDYFARDVAIAGGNAVVGAPEYNGQGVVFAFRSVANCCTHGHCGPQCPCDDANPCTDDVCNAGVCVFSPQENGTPCAPDDDECTYDYCLGGECVHIDMPDEVCGANCSNGREDAGEDRIDCGGPCDPCECLGDADCDDGIFCNGSERCNVYGECSSGANRCPGQHCDETADECLECEVDGDCSDGKPCTLDECVGGMCRNEESDQDRDSIGDCDDLCPTDPNKSQPGTCGCGVSDRDSDSDGVSDCLDSCVNTPLGAEVGTDGCAEEAAPSPRRDEGDSSTGDCGLCGIGCGITPSAPALGMTFAGILGLRLVGASRRRHRQRPV